MAGPPHTPPHARLNSFVCPSGQPDPEDVLYSVSAMPLDLHARSTACLMRWSLMGTDGLPSKHKHVPFDMRILVSLQPTLFAFGAIVERQTHTVRQSKDREFAFGTRRGDHTHSSKRKGNGLTAGSSFFFSKRMPTVTCEVAYGTCMVGGIFSHSVAKKCRDAYSNCTDALCQATCELASAPCDDLTPKQLDAFCFESDAASAKKFEEDHKVCTDSLKAQGKCMHGCCKTCNDEVHHTCCDYSTMCPGIARLSDDH